MRVMAIDLGEKRIGLALSDPSGTVALPLAVVPAVGGGKDAENIARLGAQYEVGCFVVGLPRTLRNQEGAAAARARAFAEHLRQVSGRPVVVWDERLTTAQAQRVLLADGLRRFQRRARVDKLAAALILQSYLDAHASPQIPPPSDQGRA
jgi:putative Holliday junction resolvase